MDLFDKTFSAIERKMDLHVKRHTILASDVANSETPKFIARELDFAGELKAALGTKEEPVAKTNPMHLDIASSEGAHTVLDYTGPMGADGNNVDLDITMGKLSANGTEYSKSADLFQAKMRLLRIVIQGRGGA